MNTSSLDNRVHSLLLMGMLAMFCSMAYEASRNGMADPVVAVRETPKTVVAMAATSATGPTLVAQDDVQKPR